MKSWELAANSTVYDLAQPYFTGMPHHPSHPPFLFSLVKRHGDYVSPSGASSAADAISLGTHGGTHIDALCHFSSGGKLHGGVDAATAHSYECGFSAYPIDEVKPVVRRGVLLDVAAQAGVEALRADFTVTPELLEEARAAAGVEIRSGDVVLLRTGWGAYWNDTPRYQNGGLASLTVHGPGPALEGARWLSDHGIFAAGADTIAFEKVPDGDMPVHVHLLVERGIHIVENLNLEELAQAKVNEFLFVALPLKIRGGTGAPVRPVAIV
ncbi:MAG: cyclase family protein [Bryobacteraceae bacterium]